MLVSKNQFDKLSSPKEILIYIVGCAIFSTGAYLFIHSKLGTDPLDVFSLGLKRHISITIGISQALVAVVCLGIVAIWRRRIPMLSPLFTFFFCGSLIDILLALNLVGGSYFSSMALMIFGTILCAYGSSLIIMGGFGIRAMDLLAIEMTNRWGMPFWSTKGILETILLLAGLYLGGPVGIGTLSFLLLVNGLIQPMMWINSRVLKLRNLGLPNLSASVAESVPQS